MPTTPATHQSAGKVFGTRVIASRDWPTTVKQPRIVVAAKSRAAAVRAFQQVIPHMTDSYLKTYGCETGNPAEVTAALSEPGTVFVEASEHHEVNRNYVALRPTSS